MNQIKWELPLRVVSEATNEHWTKKRKRHRIQQMLIRCILKIQIEPFILPCTVILTRTGPKVLDDDNLPSAFKYIRDEIAACLLPEKVAVYKNKRGHFVQNKGHADSDRRITWKYAQ